MNWVFPNVYSRSSWEHYGEWRNDIATTWKADKGLGPQGDTNKEMVQTFRDHTNKLFGKLELYGAKVLQLQKENHQMAMKAMKQEANLQLLELQHKQQDTIVEQQKEHIKLVEVAHDKQVQEVFKFNKWLLNLAAETFALAKMNVACEANIQHLKQNLTKLSEREAGLESRLDQLEKKEGELKDICKQLIKRKKKNSFLHLFKWGKKKEHKEEEMEGQTLRPKGPKRRPEEEKMGAFMKWIFKFK